MDMFNVTNNNTIQALRGNQNATNANNIQAIVAPRVHPVRCSRELVSRFVREERKGRVPRGPAFFFVWVAAQFT